MIRPPGSTRASTMTATVAASARLLVPVSAGSPRSMAKNRSALLCISTDAMAADLAYINGLQPPSSPALTSDGPLDQQAPHGRQIAGRHRCVKRELRRLRNEPILHHDHARCQSSTEPGETAALAFCGAACFTQLYSVAAFTDSFGASRSHASLRDSSGPISSNTNLTAWSLNSGVYSLRAGIPASSQDLKGPDAKPRPVHRRQRQVEILAGHRHDRWRLIPDGWRLLRREICFAAYVLPTKSLSLFY